MLPLQPSKMMVAESSSKYYTYADCHAVSSSMIIIAVAQDETSDIERTNKDFYDARTSSINAREEKQKTFLLGCIPYRVSAPKIFVGFY